MIFPILHIVLIITPVLRIWRIDIHKCIIAVVAIYTFFPRQILNDNSLQSDMDGTQTLFKMLECSNQSIPVPSICDARLKTRTIMPC